MFYSITPFLQRMSIPSIIIRSDSREVTLLTSLMRISSNDNLRSSEPLRKLLVLVCVYFLLSCGFLQAQTYRVERFQDGRPLRQGKFLIGAGWSFLGIGYSVDPLGLEQNPPIVPRPEDPSFGLLSLTGSFGIAKEVDLGIELSGTRGGPSAAFWGKWGFLPYSSPFQIALQPGIGYSVAEIRLPVENALHPVRLLRSNLFVVDVSLPISYDLDKEWTLMIAPHIMTSGYNASVGWDTTAPNGLRVATLAQTEAGGLFYGITIGAKVIRPSPEWWKYLLPVPFWASGSVQLSLNWHQSGAVAFSFGYQNLFPSFGTLLTTVTQEEMDGIVSERQQKDSLVVLQKQQLELERTRNARALSAEITNVKGIGENGKEENNPTLRIEEFASLERRPLLASVFFEHNSYVIPTRYRRVRSADRMSFSVENVANLRLVEMYRNILNIVGKRLSDKPDARLMLTGNTSGVGEEANNRSLAERRANAVMDYLADVWKIAPNRMTVTIGVQTTQSPTDTANARRVELSSTDPDILRDVESNAVQRIISPTVIAFGLDIAAGVGVKQWTIELTQLEDREVRTLKLDNGTRSNLTQYVWNIAENPASMPSSSENVVARLEVTDITNRVAESSLALLPVDYISLEKKRRAAQTDVVSDSYYRWLFAEDGRSAINTDALAALKALSKQGSRLIITIPNSLNTTQEQVFREAIQAASLAPTQVHPATTLLATQTTPEERIYARCFKFEYLTPYTAKQ
jgi:outer membrane protein OmpA-like peptidoglycan-associated protein